MTFLDASTVVLGDLGGPIRSKLDAGATIVTLSDFGGEKEQEAINTGILAARPGAATGAIPRAMDGTREGRD